MSQAQQRPRIYISCSYIYDASYLTTLCRQKLILDANVDVFKQEMIMLSLDLLNSACFNT